MKIGLERRIITQSRRVNPITQEILEVGTEVGMIEEGSPEIETMSLGQGPIPIPMIVEMIEEIEAEIADQEIALDPIQGHLQDHLQKEAMEEVMFRESMKARDKKPRSLQTIETNIQRQ